MELYIHIPFCIRKCNYCDFLSFSADCDTRERYVKKLVKEITAVSKRRPQEDNAHSANRENTEKKPVIDTIFIGGGTPSILESGQLQRILDAAANACIISDDCEITMEANPGTFDLQKLMAWKKMGINRLSIGLQSANDEELKVLGRIHDFGTFEKNYRLAREAGFDNINIDLMSALPGQTITSFRRTLEMVLTLKPEHISAYSLIIEPGTPIYDEYAEMGEDIGQYGEWEEMPESKLRKYAGRMKLPGEREDRAMYAMTKALLAEAGYYRYEVSNYSKPGRECRHNIGYWTGVPYLGAGLGASSLYDGKRFSVTDDMAAYMAYEESDFLAGRHYRNVEPLTTDARMEEFMFLGMRLTKGVSITQFEKRFGRNIRDIYGDVLMELTEEKLIEIDGDSIRFTDYGMDVSNYCLAKFLL